MPIKLATEDSLLTNHGIPLFDQRGNEDKITGYIPGESGRNLVKWLFSESKFSLSLLDWNIIKAAVIRREPKVFDDFRDALQEVLNHVFEHGRSTRYDSFFIQNKNLQLHSIITAALSMLPYTEPKNGCVIFLPQYINNQWEKIAYKIEAIQLTPNYFKAPYYAYGLTPVINDLRELPTGAQAHLLFMGTNPMPTATGAHHALMSDTMPTCSVGEHLYQIGHRSIKEWITRTYQTTGLPVIAGGQSLGGSIAVIVHVNLPHMVQAEVFNPPAWLSNLRKTYQKSVAQAKKATQSEELSDRDFLKSIHGNKDPITIFTNAGDMVFQIGNYIPDLGTRIWQVHSDIRTNFFACHRDCRGAQSAANGLEFKSLDPKNENSRFQRQITTIIWQATSVPLFFFHATIMLFKTMIHFNQLLLKTLSGGPSIPLIKQPVRLYQPIADPPSQERISPYLKATASTQG